MTLGCISEAGWQAVPRADYARLMQAGCHYAARMTRTHKVVDRLASHPRSRVDVGSGGPMVVDRLVGFYWTGFGLPHPDLSATPTEPYQGQHGDEQAP